MDEHTSPASSDANGQKPKRDFSKRITRNRWGATGEGPAQQFIAKAAAYEGDECLIWPFLKLKANGHGIIGCRKSDGTKSSTTAHRAVLLLARGAPLDTSMQAAHKPDICHNPSCCNPAHLYWATPQRNSCDRYIDSTMFAAGYMTQIALARRLGVSQALVSRSLSADPTAQARVDPTVRAEVLRVAAELGYRNQRGMERNERQMTSSEGVLPSAGQIRSLNPITVIIKPGKRVTQTDIANMVGATQSAVSTALRSSLTKRTTPLQIQMRELAIKYGLPVAQ